MTVTNKQYSYPRVAVIRIDVHPTGENPINMSHAFHTSFVVRVGNLSLVPTRMKQAPTLERSLGDQRQTDPAIALGHLILPPSR
jgi:hypothetical protein